MHCGSVSIRCLYNQVLGPKEQAYFMFWFVIAFLKTKIETSSTEAKPQHICQTWQTNKQTGDRELVTNKALQLGLQK